MNTIQEQWDSFQKMAIPEYAPDIQKTEMKRAFYAGAMAMTGIYMMVSEDSINEETALGIIDGCYKEFKMFINTVENMDTYKEV